MCHRGSMEHPPRILVVDDDLTFRDVLEMRLESWGYQVKVADRASSAAGIIRGWQPDLVLSDVVMPDVSGIELLTSLREDAPHRPVILLTAHGTVEMAVEAMKLGAVDFITKPFNHEHLRAVVEESLDAARRRRKDAPAREGTPPGRDRGELGYGDFVGRSDAMQEVYELLQSVAESDAGVLITGESGTGKELAARAIHRESSRSDGPFVALNAAAIPRDLMESEIFGHEKGAFTGATQAREGVFEMADGGTLFLDEIGEMPPELQPKLLRVLDEARLRRVGGRKELSFDVRLLAATNRDPREAVREGLLREDLFFRLNILTVHLPPLRQRAGDIPLLARRFARQFSEKHGGPERWLEEDTLDLLEEHPWPGNVRELRNVMERAVVLSRDGGITPSHLPPWIREGEGTLAEQDWTFPEGATVAEAERELILRTLDETGNNKAEAARRLGISVRTIRNKLKSWDIDR
ncbi:MAG: sigma-54-dependent Fis family transcriptional regulator [Gemmatimonadales bacterium]|nr:MAG: sigma-54-dependent Fis family transcriptional regulator [Gemmatimonadales bacterium]